MTIPTKHHAQPLAALRLLLLPLLLAAALLAGCHDDHEGEHGDPIEAAIEDACKHMKDGPAKAFTLTKDATGAPDLTLKHHRHDLTFAKLDSGKMGGEGTFKIAEKGDYVLNLSDDVPIKVKDKDGKDVAAESSKSKPSQCAEAAVAHVHELAVGTYTFAFGPTDATGVKLVVEHAVAHEAH